MRHGFDTETGLIVPGLLAPQLVCMTYANKEGSGILKSPDILPWLRRQLETEELTGQNVAYDLGVVSGEYEELLKPIFKALREGRIHDTMLKQQLQDLSQGTFKFRIDDDGNATPSRYGLADLSEIHLGKYLAKGEDTWRLRYIELLDVPLERWPKEASQYAIDDSVTTFLVDEKQGLTVQNEAQQVQFSFAAQLAAIWGFRTDAARIDILKKDLSAKRDAIVASLQGTGIFRRNGTKSTKRIQELVTAAYEKLGQSVPLTDKGAVKTDEDTLRLAQDETLTKLADGLNVFKLLSSFVPILEFGTRHPILSGYNTIVKSGRCSAKSPFREKSGQKKHGFNCQQLPREGGIRECFIPREGFLYSSVDWSVAEMRALAQICLNLFGFSRLADAFNRGEDPHLVFAADMLGIPYEQCVEQYKAKDKRTKEARQFAKCFHPDTEALTQTGWKKISELSLDDDIAVAHPQNGGKSEIRWEKPLRLTERTSEKLIHLKNEGIDLRVTPDHRMLYYSSGAEVCRPSVCTPAEFSKKRLWVNAGVCVSGSISVDEQLLRLAVAVQADGHYSNPGHTIRLGFSKTRKIERLRKLLRGLPYKEAVYTNGKNGFSTCFTLARNLAEQVKELLDDKKFPWWWLKLRPDLRSIVLEEARFWDAHSPKNGVAYQYLSTVEQNVHVLQAMASVTGFKTRLTESFTNTCAKYWRLTVRTKATTRGENLKTSELEGGRVVCLTTSSSFVLVRDGGIPVITGQCGDFGIPGGLSPPTLVNYARTTFNTIMTLEQAEAVHANFFKTWPEIRLYLKHIGKLVGRGLATIEHFGSGRVAGGLGYTDCANAYFQGLVADIFKEAFFQIQEECYTVESSPLYGCRAVAALHDESLLEVPGWKAHEAALRQAEIHVETMKRWLPDVPAVAEPALMRRWYKGAEAVYENGRLIPWEPTLVKAA